MDMNKKIGKDKTVKIKNAVIAVLVIAVLVCIVLALYKTIYDEKRNNIIKDGQMTALQSAEEFNKYLDTSIDAIELSAYNIDNMLDTSTNEEILDYLVGQTTAITNTVFENTSGLYGYINGEFLDGILWVPDDDFVPTERPWYTKAIANNGEITMVEPYLDAQTGEVLMAISKMLKDGKSVVSMDITLDVIQQITEGAVDSDGTDIEFIVDNRGMVIAHSDIGEVGKNYSEEADSLGATVMALLNDSDEDYYEFHYNNSHYIAYSARIQKDWHCVFVKDATSVFAPLKIILAIAVVSILVIIVSISVIMMRSGARQLTAQRLSNQLSSTADIYISLHEINFVTDTFTEVRNNKEEASMMIGEVRNNCQQMIRTIMSRFSDDTTRESILDFVDFDKLNDRLKDVRTVTSEFLSADKKWRRARYIVSDRKADGTVARAMFLVEDIEAVVHLRGPEGEAVVMARGDRNILGACVLEHPHPLLRIELRGVEAVLGASVRLGVDSDVLLVPLALGVHGVETPVDEYPEPLLRELLACIYVPLLRDILGPEGAQRKNYRRNCKYFVFHAAIIPKPAVVNQLQRARCKTQAGRPIRGPARPQATR